MFYDKKITIFEKNIKYLERQNFSIQNYIYRYGLAQYIYKMSMGA